MIYGSGEELAGDRMFVESATGDGSAWKPRQVLVMTVRRRGRAPWRPVGGLLGPEYQIDRDPTEEEEKEYEFSSSRVSGEAAVVPGFSFFQDEADLTFVRMNRGSLRQVELVCGVAGSGFQVGRQEVVAPVVVGENLGFPQQVESVGRVAGLRFGFNEKARIDGFVDDEDTVCGDGEDGIGVPGDELMFIQDDPRVDGYGYLQMVREEFRPHASLMCGAYPHMGMMSLLRNRGWLDPAVESQERLSVCEDSGVQCVDGEPGFRFPLCQSMSKLELRGWISAPSYPKSILDVYCVMVDYGGVRRLVIERACVVDDGKLVEVPVGLTLAMDRLTDVQVFERGRLRASSVRELLQHHVVDALGSVLIREVRVDRSIGYGLHHVEKLVCGNERG